jgi:hypothetical protein
MTVRAYNWKNSTSIDLQEIKRANKYYQCAAADNYDIARDFGLVVVRVYETRTRYHYEVRFLDVEHHKLDRTVCFSSTKQCNPHWVAHQLVAKSSDL